MIETRQQCNYSSVLVSVHFTTDKILSTYDLTDCKFAEKQRAFFFVCVCFLIPHNVSPNLDLETANGKVLSMV